MTRTLWRECLDVPMKIMMPDTSIPHSCKGWHLASPPLVKKKMCIKISFIKGGTGGGFSAAGEAIPLNPPLIKGEVWKVIPLNPSLQKGEV